jgi:hypothetical protein
MMIVDRIQKLITEMESTAGRRLLWAFACCLALAGLVIWYDIWSYRGFSAPEAMDTAQVARNLADGHGYATQCIVPLRFYLMKSKGQVVIATQTALGQRGGYYADLGNPPVYPTVLAGLMKLAKPKRQVEMKNGFWAQDGRFLRYKPEFLIAIFNQCLLMAVVGQTFFLAKKWFDPAVGWLSALVTLGSNELWQFSTSGLSTMLLLVIFLGLTLCLTGIESLAREAAPRPKRLPGLAITAGALAALGMLTRYSFGWLIVPVLIFLAVFGGAHRKQLMLLTGGVFGLMVTPWLARNYAISGQLFGLTGFSLLEGTSLFPGLTLIQSANPAMAGAEMHGGWLTLILHKLLRNALAIFQNDLPHLAGWAGVLFFAGLLLGFRDPAPRRLRYFTLMSLACFVAAQALGRTWLSDATPEINSENLLVLTTPLAVVFGIAFFLTLLEQMTLPNLATRYAAMITMAAVLCLPFLVTFLPPKPSPLAYPPYYPPEIQKVSSWMGQDELMMSDMPWAVAWYGQHACISLSRDTQDNFYAINDYFQPVKGIYLTSRTLDDKFFANVLRSEHDQWNRLVLNFVIKDAVDKEMAANFDDQLSNITITQKNRTDFLNGFPLRTAKSLDAGLFFTDRPRWTDDH